MLKPTIYHSAQWLFCGIIAFFLLSFFDAAFLNAARFELVSTVGFGDELTCIGMSHRDPKFVMIGTATGKIHRTTDGGQSWQEIVVTPSRSLYFGRERQPDPRFEYALGLPGKSPHLQSWLRQKGLHTSGVNWQQLLVKKGDKSVAVTWIEVDWHDENRVYVGTPDGLYRSLDKGRSFHRIWQGRANMSERMINAIATDPANPKHLLLGTAGGLFYSTNRGTTFRKEMSFYVHGGYIRGFYFDREQKGLVHMAMGGSAMASLTSGIPKNSSDKSAWITTYWHLWGPRSSVQWMSLGPENIRLIATRDGVYASFQGGEMGTWKRRGFRFIGTNVISVLATKTKNQWYAATPAGIWFSEDYGNNWRKVMQLGGKEIPRWMEAYDNDPKHFWMITNRHVYRFGGVPKERGGGRRRNYRRLLDMPTLQDFWTYVMKHKHLHFEDVQAYRDRAPWAALLPDLYAGATYVASNDYVLLRGFPYIRLPYSYYTSYGNRGLNFYVMAYWDLSRIIFDRRKLPHFGRIDRYIKGDRQDLSERIHRLYNEYRALVTRMLDGAPRRPLVRILERNRLEEIHAFFDSISNNYWSKHTGGL